MLALHGHIFDDQWLDKPRACCRFDTTVPGSPPQCATCGNRLRPAVVWFGEMLPTDALEAAHQAARTGDLMLVVGTSGVVYPAAGLAQAVPAGAKVVILNPEPTGQDDAAHAVLRGKSARLLPDTLRI